jgi:hypothetical protein
LRNPSRPHKANPPLSFCRGPQRPGQEAIAPRVWATEPRWKQVARVDKPPQQSKGTSGLAGRRMCLPYRRGLAERLEPGNCYAVSVDNQPGCPYRRRAPAVGLVAVARHQLAYASIVAGHPKHLTPWVFHSHAVDGAGLALVHHRDIGEVDSIELAGSKVKLLRNRAHDVVLLLNTPAPLSFSSVGPNSGEPGSRPPSPSSVCWRQCQSRPSEPAVFQ